CQLWDHQFSVDVAVAVDHLLPPIEAEDASPARRAHAPAQLRVAREAHERACRVTGRGDARDETAWAEVTVGAAALDHLAAGADVRCDDRQTRRVRLEDHERLALAEAR